MFDSSLITYAVSLHFGREVNEIIFSAMKKIAEQTGNSFMLENKVPPQPGPPAPKAGALPTAQHPDMWEGESVLPQFNFTSKQL